MCNTEKQKKGLRCRVCTGCGLCPGVLRPEVKEQKIHVLADLPGEGQGELPSAHGTRLAVADIGTTTIAMLLYDTEGRVEARHVTVNPQVKYGADVISRIHAAQEPQCARDLHDLVRKELEKGLQRFRDMLSTGEKLQLVIAANTTMTYLMMGWDTSELGRAPFRATRLLAVETTLGEVPCYIMPGMSAFVGGDITSGMYACGMDREEEITLAPKELQLLLVLLERKGWVFSRDQLLDLVWGPDYMGNDRVVDNHIRKLRKSLGCAGKQIRTVTLKGYKLVED